MKKKKKKAFEAICVTLEGIKMLSIVEKANAYSSNNLRFEFFGKLKLLENSPS